MPQMMPIHWLALMISCLALLISMTSFLYFNSMNLTPLYMPPSKKLLIKWNWTWL